MAKVNRGKKEPPKRMNAREFLYAFCGILMQRKATIICDEKHEASTIGELAGAFADANKMPAFRDNVIPAKWPEGTDYLTNVPQNECAVAKPIDLDEVLAQILFQLAPLSPENQNATIARLLKAVHVRRKERHQQDLINQSDRSRMEALSYDQLRQFENIVAGNFSVID